VLVLARTRSSATRWRSRSTLPPCGASQTSCVGFFVCVVCVDGGMGVTGRRRRSETNAVHAASSAAEPGGVVCVCVCVCVCVRARARAARRSAGRSVQLAATRRCVRELVCVCVCVTVCVVCASERAWPRRRAAATTSKLQ
jgi:hypothetical protein